MVVFKGIYSHLKNISGYRRCYLTSYVCSYVIWRRFLPNFSRWNTQRYKIFLKTDSRMMVLTFTLSILLGGFGRTISIPFFSAFGNGFPSDVKWSTVAIVPCDFPGPLFISSTFISSCPVHIVTFQFMPYFWCFFFCIKFLQFNCFRHFMLILFFVFF